MRMNPLRRLAAVVVLSSSVQIAAGGLGGCMYLETQLQRTATPDNRIKLGWQDRVFLSGRELVNYTCDGNYMLTCERAGITFSCTCVLQ